MADELKKMCCDKQSAIILAKLSEQSERYNDMVSFMKMFIETYDGRELQDEERNLMSVAFKNVVGGMRAGCKMLDAKIPDIEENAQGLDEKTVQLHLKVAKDYREELKKELLGVCNEVIELLDKYLVPNASSSYDPKVQVFYQKMKGDYFRYQVEVANDSDEKSSGIEHAAQAYEKADETACCDLAPTDPVRLGLALNFSVFFYEILEDKKGACTKAREAFDKAMDYFDCQRNLDQEPDADRGLQDTRLIMQLLRDNLTLWTDETESG